MPAFRQESTKTATMSVWCPNCKENVDVEELVSEGVTCCTACGTVIDDTHFSSDPTFSKNAAGASQVDGNFVPEGGVGASGLGLSGAGGGFGYGGRGRPQLRLYGLQTDSHEKTMARAKSELSTLAERLGARPKEELVEAAHRLYRLAVQKNFTRGRRTGQVVGACLYIVCRQEDKPYMLIDISDLLATNVYILGGVFLQLCQLLRLNDQPVMQKPVDPSLFIPRFADRLNLGAPKTVVAHSATRLVASMKRDWMQTGRRPSGVCGAALYVAAAMHGVPRSKREVIAAVHVGETTLAKRLSEFEETSTGSMTAEEFKHHAHELEERQRLELEGAAAEQAGELICVHQGVPGYAHFALGLCRQCYADLTKASGGTKEDGALPPIMIKQHKKDEDKKMKRLKAIEEGTVDDDDEEEEHEDGFDENELEAMDQVITMTEQRLSGVLKNKDVGSSEEAIGMGSAATPASTAAAARAKLIRAATRRDEDPDQGAKGVTVGSTEGVIENKGNGDDDNLSDVDDDELNEYINTEDETKLKQVLWEELNRDYIEKKAAKEAKLKAEAEEKEEMLAQVEEAEKVAKEAGIILGRAALSMEKASGPGRKRKKQTVSDGTEATAAVNGGSGGDGGASTSGAAGENASGPVDESAEAAARHLMTKKKLSSKINYVALKNLFQEEPMTAARAGPGTEAARRQKQREQDRHEASKKHMSALEEDARTRNFRKATAGYTAGNFGNERQRKRVSFDVAGKRF